jgi:glyoxylase-like metal-dependent hydrolase (beta-lactamase superfamily II)
LSPLSLQIETIESQPFGENSYLAYLAGSKECVVVDPGMEPDLILEQLDANDLNLAGILITHAHGDHIAGIPSMKARFPLAPVYIGREEAPKLGDPWANLSAPFGMPITLPPADVLLDDGQTFEVAGMTFEVAAIAGHSSGHIVFIWRGPERAIVFGGDVLFNGSIGRTDLPGGSFEALAKGIREKLYTLPDDTLILSGHGPETTVGQEKRTNPYVRAK